MVVIYSSCVSECMQWYVYTSLPECTKQLSRAACWVHVYIYWALRMSVETFCGVLVSRTHGIWAMLLAASAFWLRFGSVLSLLGVGMTT